MSVQAGQHFNLSATLRQVVRESLRVLHADRAALFLRPPNGDALRIGASVGLSQNYLDAVSEKWKELPVGRMLRRPKLCFWADARCDSHFKALKAEIEREGYCSIANVPLLSEGVFQGWLAFYFDEVRDLSDEEKSTIQTFADLAAVAIENSRLYEREREASRQLDRLQELALQVSSSLRPSEVLESIAKTTVELLDGSQSRIYLLEAATDHLICKASHGITTSVHDAPYPMKVGMGVGGEVARSRKPHISPDVQKNPKWLNVPWVRSLDLHSFICVPLLSSGEVLGIINCLSQRVDQFGDADLRLLESLAGHAAIAIEKAQHVESLKARIEEREGLVGALGHVASGLDVETIIRAVLSESARVMGTDRCCVMLPDPQSGDPRLFTSQGISSDFVEGIATLPEPFPLGRAYLLDPARAEPTVIQEVGENPVFGEIQAREGHRTLAAFPLRLGNRNIGALFYFWTAPQTLDDQQLLLGQAFAKQVAIAIENATLYQKAQDDFKRLVTLNEISQKVTSSLDLDETLNSILHAARDLTQSSYSQVWLLNPQGKQNALRAVLSPTEITYPPGATLNEGEGLTGWVIERNEFLAVREVRSDPRWVDEAWSRSWKMASYLGVPIRSMGEVIGALVCLTEEPRDRPEGVVEAVSGLAAHAAIAIENARSYEEIRIRSDRQEALRKVTRDITQNLDLTELFSRICRSVSELLGVEISHLFLLDEKTGALNVVSAFGEKEGEELPIRSFPKGKGLNHRVASRKEHVAVAEVLKDPDWITRDWAERAGIQSFLGIPLILGDRVVGVLNGLTKQVRNFRADEIELMRDFADQAAVALDNARAFSQISQKSFQIEKLNEINRKLASAHELNEILETILEASKDLVGGRCAVVYLHDEANGCLVPRSRTRGGFLAEVNLPPMKLGEGLLGWVARERQPLVVQDAQGDSRWVPKPWNQNLRLGPFAGLPLVSRDSLFGVLAFFSEADHALSEEEFHLLASFADQAAIAIEKAQQVESLKARIKEQEGLVSALGHVASGLDVERVIQAVLSESARVMGTNRCSVMLPDPQSGELRLIAGQGISSEFVERLKALPEPFPIGRAYLLHPEKDEPTVIQEVGEDPVIGEVQVREGHRTLAAFPLRLGDRNIGSLFYFWTTPQTVDEQKLLLGQAFAEQVAIAVQNSRLLTEARERAMNLEILDEIAKAINSTLDLEEIFKNSLEQLKRVVPCDESTLYILGADKMVISDFYLDSDGEDRRRWIESRRDLAGSQFEQIFKMKKPLYFPDARKSPYSRHQSLAAMGLRSALHAPILSEGACVGFLSVSSPEVNAFTGAHIDLLESVADHLALAMRNAELFSRAETRATNLEIVDEIAKAIDSTLDLEELFKITVEQVKRMVPSERSSLFIVDSDKGIVSHAYFVDVNGNRGNHLAPRKLEETYFEQVIKTKQPLYTRDTAEGSHPRLQLLAAAGLRSLVNVPVLSEGECIGSLNVTSSEANAYTDEHIELLQSVADHLAIAMKNAELYAEVRETSERLDSFVRSASDGIATVDLEARITSWNPGMEAIYGYSEKEMHGEHILRIFPEEKGEFKKFWGRLISGEIVPPSETVRQRKDGTLVEVSVTVSPIRDSTGQVVGISGIHRDIGAKKRAEEALRKSEGKYRTLFEEASDAIEIVDEKGRIVDCNQHACDLLGYTREEMLKKQLQDIVAPEYRDSVRQRVTRIIDEGMIPYESANMRKDGSVVPIEVSAASIEIEGRKRVIYFLRDITERKQAEEELQKTEAKLYQSEKLASIGTLVAGVAHEILNPTHIISLQVQMLQKGMVADAPEKMDETYRTIEGQVKRITRTTRNLLQFARQREPQVKSLDIREVLNPLVKLVEDQYRVESVELVPDYAQELPPVDGDEDQLTQVFLNLISNAKDAMPDGGQITLRARSSFWNGAPWIQISVEDTGKGIRDDVLKRIFDPFYTTKPEGKGTGLGLSVSYGIVEGHGGKLTVESREGKGTTLLVELPASEKVKAEET